MKKPGGKLIIIFFIILIFLSSVFSVSGLKQKVTINDRYEYYTYSKMTSLLLDLQANYSDIMFLESIGKSYEDREIWMVKISDNPTYNENEPGVLLMGAHHGNEKPSFEVLINFTKYLTDTYGKLDVDTDNDGSLNEDIIDGRDNDNDGLTDEDPSEKRVKDIVDNTQIFIIPMVNPDGVEADTRTNCNPVNVVNLNRNYDDPWKLYYLFPALYGAPWLTNPGSFNYRGEYPFSELETQAIKSFVEQNDINISLSYHTYGEIIFFPWFHTTAKTPHEDFLISVGENMTDINNYELYIDRDYPIPLPGGTLGTSENWLYREHGILSYTMELCRTRAPTDPDIVEEYLLTHIGVNLYVCERAPTIQIDGPPKIRTRLESFSHVLSLLHQRFHRLF